MRELVKLGDLEGMAEPPLHGTMVSPPVTQQLQGDEDMALETGAHRGSPSSGYLRPEDSPLGFRPSANSRHLLLLIFVF